MPASVPRPAATLVDVLRDRAASTPNREALVFLDDGPDPVTYAELDRDARSLASALLAQAGPGDRALILLPPGRAYVTAFLGCLYAGVVAVPQYPPTARRGAGAVLATAADADVAVAVSDAAGTRAMAVEYPELAALPRAWVVTEDVPQATLSDPSWPGPAPGSLALLQYTSGSTGTPKGVMVRHDNLAHCSAAIASAIGARPSSRGVSWLPPYHDMGLIGGILQPLYSGFTGMLMAPLTFLREPFRWLDAISRYRATHTAAPDFGYLESARRISPQDAATLDLSCLEHALIGAEPVRPSTLEAFCAVFGPQGFRPSAFHPCYGLAEATLLVTGGRSRAGRPRVVTLDRAALRSGVAREAAGPPLPAVSVTGCGAAVSQDRVVVAQPGSLRPCADGEVGEILVSGPTVAAGYWRRADAAREVFWAAVPGLPGAFLRTGDLGFQLDGDLFVTGRAKDLIIVGGRNYFPPDLEVTGESAHHLITPSRSAAFAADVDGSERVVLVHEVVRGFRAEDAAQVIAAVTAAVTTDHGIAPHEVVLVRPGRVPTTTSGKVRRGRCRELWLEGHLPRLSPVTRPGTEIPAAGLGAAASAVAGILGRVLKVSHDALAADVPLVALGLDSLGAARVVGALRDAFGAAPELTELLGDLTPRGLAEWAATVPPRPTSATPTAAEPAAGEPTAGQPAVRRASGTQEWLWLLDRMGAGAAYTIVGGVRLRGAVDVARLRRAFATGLGRHPVLRTTFALGEDGTLLAVVQPEQPVPLPVVDISGDSGGDATAVVARLASQAFDLAAGPLLRAVLVRSGEQDWTLGVAVHHIVVDGWSLAILLRELGSAYDPAGRPAEDPTGQPAGHPVGPAPGDAAYWRAALEGARAAALPLDRPPVGRPEGSGRRTWRGAAAPLSLPAPLAGMVRAYAAAHRATPFMVLLTALALVLGRRTGQADLVVGTPAARRDAATAGAVGLFVNTLPIRVDLSGDPAFAELLGRVRGGCLAAYGHQNLSFEKIMESADLGDPPGPRAPLVRVCLAVQNLPFEPWQAGGVTAEPFELPSPGAQFELTISLAERPDGSMSGHTVHAADLLDEDTVAGIRDELVAVLSAAAGGDEHPLPPREASRGVLAHGDEPFELVSLAGSGPAGFVGARDDVEARLAAIWCEVIDLPEVSVDAEFFELGGHSLQAARIVARIEAAFGVPVRVEDILTAETTIESLAAVVRDLTTSPADPDVESAVAELGQLSNEEIADLLGAEGEGA